VIVGAAPVVPVVLTPLGIEARAVRAGLLRAVPAGEDAAVPAMHIVRTGMGAHRAACAAARVHHALAPGVPVAVAGFAGGLRPGLVAGDVVVATEVHDAHGPGRGADPGGAADVERPVGDADAAVALELAPVGDLLAELRRLGLRVIAGPIATSRRPVFSRRHRAALGRTGALAVDLESAAAVRALPGRPVAVLRVITDTATAGLLHPGLIRRGLRARRALAAAAPALAAWAAAASTPSPPPDDPGGTEDTPRGVPAPEH
jgi:4-hydroxy-3-methylbut-2-enyl diphosphate reductase